MYNGKNAYIWIQEKTFFDAYEDLCTRSWFLVTISQEMKVITSLSTFRKIQNEISSLRPKFTTISIFGWNYGKKCSIFLPKNENVENFCFRLEISFWIFRKVERGVITFNSYDIVTRNHDLMRRSSYMSENAFSCIQIYAFLHYTYFITDHLLPKRSTHVDQTLESESMDSLLSIAIFRAPRDLLVTQDDSI